MIVEIALRVGRSFGLGFEREKKKEKKKPDEISAHAHQASSCLCVCAVSTRFTERRGKKTVRFDGGTNVGGSQEEWSWEADRQGSQDSATKDSGIDTSSTFTSSEDSNRGDLPKVRARVVSRAGHEPARETLERRLQLDEL